MLLLVRAALAGPIAPPAGPVAPTPGPEPRIAVNATNTPGDASALFVISQPGSYYLAGNITGVVGKHGIRIITDGVTLDLNGFDLAGVAGMGVFDGVTTAGAASSRNLCVRNGSLREWGGNGISIVGQNSRVEGVRVYMCGGHGISIGNISSVTGCSAVFNSGHGIATGSYSTVRNCYASFNTQDGVHSVTQCTVSGCEAIQNGRSGITVSDGSRVLECGATANSEFGIEGASDCLVDTCAAKDNGYDGIRVQNRCRVTDNLITRNGTAGLYAGIFANGNNTRVEGNHVVTGAPTDSGISVAASGTGNFVVRNYVQGSGAINYTYPAAGGNFIGTITGNNAAMNGATNDLVNISF